MPFPQKNDLLTAAERKEVASLATAKGRRSLGCFMAEGTRCVLDSLPHFRLRRLYATAACLPNTRIKRPSL